MCASINHPPSRFNSPPATSTMVRVHPMILRPRRMSFRDPVPSPFRTDSEASPRGENRPSTDELLTHLPLRLRPTTPLQIPPILPIEVNPELPTQSTQNPPRAPINTTKSSPVIPNTPGRERRRPPHPAPAPAKLTYTNVTSAEAVPSDYLGTGHLYSTLSLPAPLPLPRSATPSPPSTASSPLTVSPSQLTTNTYIKHEPSPDPPTNFTLWSIPRAATPYSDAEAYMGPDHTLECRRYQPYPSENFLIGDNNNPPIIIPCTCDQLTSQQQTPSKKRKRSVSAWELESNREVGEETGGWVDFEDLPYQGSQGEGNGIKYEDEDGKGKMVVRDDDKRRSTKRVTFEKKAGLGSMCPN